MTPQPHLLYLLALWTLVGIVAALWPPAAEVWKLGGALLAITALLDIIQVRRLPAPRLTRRINGNLPVGVWSRARLELENLTSGTQVLTLHDLHPESFQTSGLPAFAILPPRHRLRMEYQVMAPRRGEYRFAGVDILLASPMGMWRHKRRLDLPHTVKVYPNFAEISRYTLLATDNRLSRLGVRRRPRRGEGNDFHQLREYRRGDSLRQIDWKASSRYRRLISREYQDERDQQVLFLLDCGRRMRHVQEGRLHLDESLNAMLLLAYVAVQQGDSVGFMAFAGERRWYAPRKGAHVVNEILGRTYDLQAGSGAADYLEAAAWLMPLQRRRALIVIITNTRDEDHADLITAVRLLRRRHLVVVADLRESVLDDILGRPVGDLDSALRFQATQAYLDSRRQNHETLRHQGALVLDILARQLPIALVNQYLAIKGGGRL